jgi:hypothetical protein
MKKLLIASALAISSLAAGSAEAACRQVYGGTSCFLGKCWHNAPKTVCDAPARVAAPPPKIAQPVIQPGGRIINQDNAGLISNKGGGIITHDGRSLIGNAGGAMRRP